MSWRAGSLAELIDGIVDQRRVAARVDAGLAGRMVAFCDARRADDLARQAEAEADGRTVRTRPGEFAADELSLATTMSVHDVQCLVAMTRRVQTRIPSVWDAWSAGDVDRDKVRQIDKCLRRLRTDEAVSVLEFEVLEEAIAKTTEQLKAWLNRFVARHEADEHRHPERAAFADRGTCRSATTSTVSGS